MSMRDFGSRRPASLLLLSIVCAVLAGCASPGTPRPPSLHLPEPVANLVAERVGDDVNLHWTTSAKTTDGLAIKGPVTAEICRATGTQDCIPVRRVPVRPGPSEATERLPTPLATGPATLLTYRVQLMNAGEHSAGSSNPALTAAGPPPPLVADLTARASAQGALLRWRPQDAADAIELNRRRVDIPGPAMPAQAPLAPLGKGTAKEASERNLRVRSTALPNNPFRLDAGGTLDQSARRGETYTYRAQRIRSIVVAGHTFELRSASSDPVTLVMRDVFPPSPPTGLEAIVNGAGAAASIDLSWQPGTEADLAGYKVYRQEGTAPPIPLTSSPVQIPGFRDTAAVAGHRYRYTVTAVDAAGNESAASAPADEALRQP